MKTVTINGREKYLRFRKLNYDQLMMLAFGPGVRPGLATITYFNGSIRQPKGSVLPGESVSLRTGMSFSVIFTDKG